ncbi:MAG: AMP-binding protein [Chlamydiota bacterium]
MKRLLAAMALALLSLRYRVRVNDSALAKSSGRGMLFLPNHTAEIDPIIINTLLFGRFRPRPLVVEYFYYLKGARLVMKLVRALPVPNFEVSANQWKVRQVEKCLETVKKGLSLGDNFLIYPSGQLKRDGHETIGGNSFVQRLLAACPDVQIVLVRTTGLWGSLFSRAITGKSPHFWHTLYKGVVALVKSGIFFLPRRRIEVTFAIDPPDFPRQGTRMEINSYLERWYNRYRDEKGNTTDSEPLKLVSLSCWSKKLPAITAEKPVEQKATAIEVPAPIQTAVVEKLALLSGRPKGEITKDQHLSRDLGLDSLDFSELQAFLDEQFGIERFVPEELQTVGAIFRLVATGEALDKPPPPPFEWPEDKKRAPVVAPHGKTIQEAFLHAAKRMGAATACADAVTGALSYHRLKIAALALERLVRDFPGRYIGVLLPSSVGGYIAILAVLLAGKIPVVLNWTMGARSLNFAADLLQIKIVLTARRFLERLDVLELGMLENNLVLMEEIRPKIKWWHKVDACFQAQRSTAALLNKLDLARINPDDPAVVLFTSGTETYPKAVPLSHANLLGNQRAMLETTTITNKDLLYGVLPPFHSFGFSVTGLFPLLIGLKVFYAPDPTDSRAMARDLGRCQVTIACSAPSFYRQLFKIASPADLKNIRLFVSGAEKATPDLFAFVAKLEWKPKMLEGYGITECSPVVTLNRENEPACGVGRPLSGVELCLIDPDTEKKIDGKEACGEVCIWGVNVFAGYLGSDTINPFIEIDGKRWYRSGDLGTIDPSGALCLSGRLKRFVKIGGEMVSLMALEEEMTLFAKRENRIPTDEIEPQIAIGVKKASEESKPELVVFTTFPLTREEANGVLRQAGFGRIVKVAAAQQIDTIPVTGTGKVHDRRIREMSNELVL